MAVEQEVLHTLCDSNHRRMDVGLRHDGVQCAVVDDVVSAHGGVTDRTQHVGKTFLTALVFVIDGLLLRFHKNLSHNENE